MNVLNKKSGVLGLSKKSSDFRDLIAGVEAGDELCKNTLDVFFYRVAKYIGAYTAAMNGVDAIAFTAGLGENNAKARAAICSYLGYLGITIDEAKNESAVGEEEVITTTDSARKVLVVPTNEELAIARETVALVK